MHPLTVKVHQAAKAVLTQRGHSLFTPQRVHRYELILLTETNMTLEQCDVLNQTANIYIDSKSALGVAFATGRIWKERGFLMSARHKIAQREQILDLLHALEKTKQVAVLYHEALQRDTSALTDGNNLADGAAKAAALQPLRSNQKYRKKC